MLSVSDLTMRFGGLKAVDSLSFEARAGDITAVIGPNGAGKTTVFNCITGFYRPTTGTIVLTHPDSTAYPLQRMAGHRIAAVAKVARTFQNIRLFAGMTVLENLLVATAQHPDGGNRFRRPGGSRSRSLPGSGGRRHGKGAPLAGFDRLDRPRG